MATIGDAIRDEIDRSGVSLYRIQKDTGLAYSTIHRFYHEAVDVRLSTVEKLAEYLRLELKPKRGK